MTAVEPSRTAIGQGGMAAAGSTASRPTSAAAGAPGRGSAVPRAARPGCSVLAE